jgi:hypothetical protein
MRQPHRPDQEEPWPLRDDGPPACRSRTLRIPRRCRLPRRDRRMARRHPLTAVSTVGGCRAAARR